MRADSGVHALTDDIDAGLPQDEDWLKAHENDYPVLRLVGGTNPPLTVTLRQ